MNPAEAATTTTATPERRLSRQLALARRRMMARGALESVAAMLPWCAGSLAILVGIQSLLGARSPFAIDPARLLLLSLASLAAALLAAAIHGALAARLPDLPLGLLIDRGLGLQERVTAAVALRAAPDSETWTARALEVLDGRDVRKALPFRPLPWRASSVALLGLAAAFLVPPWPMAAGPQDAPHDAAVVAAARALEEEVKAAEEKLEERGASEEAQRVLEEIRKSAQRAQLEPLSRDEAIADLQRLDQQARREQQERQAADAGALERALSSLEQATMRRDAARQADQEEARSLEKQMQALAEQFSQGTSFEDRDRKRVAARLREAAEALAETHPELSEKLEELAQAIESGDMERAQQLASELATSAELQQLSSEAATSEALEQAQRMVQQALGQLGRAPTDRELAEAREAAEGEAGEGSGPGKPGDAPRPGRDRSGQPVVGTDWGVGTTNEAAAEFQIGGRGQQAHRQSSETSDWREAYEALHESTTLDGASGRNTRVRGQLGEGELVAVETRQVSQAPESASLPVVQVPESYVRANEEAMAREEIPSAYRDGVRRYFNSLDSPSAPAGATGTAPSGADDAPRSGAADD